MTNNKERKKQKFEAIEEIYGKDPCENMDNDKIYLYQKFWNRVDIPIDNLDKCWNWTGGTFSNGYGAFWAGDATVKAHRYAYSFKEDIPNNAIVIHRCDSNNKLCVNPNHLHLRRRIDNFVVSKQKIESIDKNTENKTTCNPMSKDFQDKCKKLGLTGNQYIQILREEGKLVNPTDVKRKESENIIKRAGCNSWKEYKDKTSQNLGYKDYAEREKFDCWEKGIRDPMEIKECSSNFGVVLGENVFEKFLFTIFEDVKHMKFGNKTFDFICKNHNIEFVDTYSQFNLERNKEYKIQIKVACLKHRGKRIYWDYPIRYDRADYFILSGWDDRSSLNILHIWMFHKNEMIKKGYGCCTPKEKFWKRDSIVMTNKQEYLKNFKNNDITTWLKLKKVNEILKEIIDKYIKDKKYFGMKDIEELLITNLQ